MKTATLLLVALWAAVSCVTCSPDHQNQPSKPSELSRAAAAQLQRLAPFRRSGLDEPAPASNKPANSQQTSPLDPRQTRSSAKPVKKPAEPEFQIPIDFVELFRIFSDSIDLSRDKRQPVPIQLTPDKMDKLNKYADKLMQDERVQTYLQERIKRDGGYGGGYGGGSGSGGSGAFVSGLAGQVVGSVIGLSSSASRGSSSSSSSSSHPAPVYGPPAYHSYGKSSFSIWDFKRAILNTLIQAVKAVGGGVLALKGQLIKGSGFLVSTKGRIISSAGDAITGFGKSLAASAVVQPPHPSYGHSVGYAYEAPAAHVVAHDHQYDGPPPNPDYHSTFGTASDDDSVVNHQPGLLIGKPTPDTYSDHLQTDHLQSDHLQSDHLQSDHLQSDHVESDHQHYTQDEHVEDLDPRKPNFDVKDVVSHLTGASGGYQGDHLQPPQVHPVDEVQHIPGNTLQLQEHNQQNYDLYPPLGNGPNDDKTLQQPPVNDYKNPHVFAQSYEQPSVAYKTPYGLPPPKYGVPIPDYQHQNYLPPKPHHNADIQIEISDHDITGFESGGYGQHILKRHPAGVHLVTMQGPLKIPILGPHPGAFHKSAGFPPGHVNSIGGVGKYPRYGPSFEVQPSIAYELRKRRDGMKIPRI